MNIPQEAFSRGPLANGQADILCVHFSVDPREHAMWYLDAADAGPALTGFTAGLRTEWNRSRSGVYRATVFRQDGVLCDAVLLVHPPLDAESHRSSLLDVRRDAAALRGEGLASHPAALLSSLRQRPLLATFARRVELPPPLARHVHGLLLRTAPLETSLCLCGGGAVGACIAHS
jgi:hypothetical protein